MSVKMTLSLYADSLTNRGEIASGPVAFQTLIFFKTEYTFHEYKNGGKSLLLSWSNQRVPY